MFSDNSFINRWLELPNYWRSVRRMEADLLPLWKVEKITFGPHPEQYALSVKLKEWPNNKDRKLAIYFHGGAWTFGTPERFMPAARLFLEAGYEVILPSYRKLPFHRFNAINEDLILLRDHVLTGRKVEVIGGMSAGGHLAALIGWREDYWKSVGLAIPTKLLLCGAVIDLVKMNVGLGVRFFVGKKRTKAYNDANPIYHFDKASQLPKYHLLIHGDKDRTVNFNQSACFYDSHKENSKTKIELLKIDNGTHLDSGRWTFEENEAANQIRLLLKK